MKRVAAIVDNIGWCWHNTTAEIIPCLPEYHIEMIRAIDFRNRVRDPRVDLVYARGYSTILGDVPRDVPVIWTFTTGGRQMKEKLDEMRASKTDKTPNCFAVIVQCRAAQIALEYAGYKNIVIIPNPVNTQHFGARPGSLKNNRLIGLAGNTKEIRRAILKGAQFIERAVAIRNAEYPRGPNYLTYVHAGELKYPQMPAFYRQLWAYVQPSSSEGCSNSVMEAMATGLPALICQGVGYHGETCRDAREYDNGQVLFVKRDAESIAQALRDLENDALYDRVSANARRFAEMHSAPNIAERFRRLFDAATASRPVVVKNSQTTVFTFKGS